MSSCPACQRCFYPDALPKAGEPEVERRKAVRGPVSRPTRLFNGITALLVSGWVAIVAIALEKSERAELADLPTLEAFLAALL